MSEPRTPRRPHPETSPHEASTSRSATGASPARRTPQNRHFRGDPEIRPLDVDGVGTAVVGSLAWAIALVALLPFYDSLRDQGREWWVWTCLAGLGLGLIGLEYCRRRRAKMRA